VIHFLYHIIVFREIFHALGAVFAVKTTVAMVPASRLNKFFSGFSAI